jgi:hypothetical protein
MGLGILNSKEETTATEVFCQAANIMMMYHLCDIMTWTLCPDDQGIVPQHDELAFKAPNNTVSIQYLHQLSNIVIDVTYSSHALISIFIVSRS